MAIDRPATFGKSSLWILIWVWLGASTFLVDKAAAANFLASNPASITAAAAAAGPGDTITMLTNGTWNNATITFMKNNASTNPITLRAQVPGKVLITGGSHLYIGGSNLVVQGLVFTNGSSTETKDIIEFRSGTGSLEARNCRLTDTELVNLNPSDQTVNYKWVSFYGQSNRMDHCLLRGKTNVEATVTVWMTSYTPSNSCHQIDHNYFDKRYHYTFHDSSASMRLGDSSTSQQSCGTLVEWNYFHDCTSAEEIISNKSCDNMYRYNTFVGCLGCLTFRHGKRCSAIGNFFFGNSLSQSAGIRIIDSDHTVIDNYFQDLGCTGAGCGGGVRARRKA